MIIIKRYCQKINIQDEIFIEQCCHKYLKGKWTRRDVLSLLSDFSGLSQDSIKDAINSGEKYGLYWIVTEIASHISLSIKNRKLFLPPIKYHQIIDGMTKKERTIGVQHPLHQMYDYVIVEAMLPMFTAKIGVFQCASLPKKGQSYGKKHIERWVKEKETVYFVKGDIKKCFPSISQENLKRLIERDIKNEDIAWLSGELIDCFDEGISIGSFFSQYLCNYYLSYAYHYASEKLFKTRKVRRNNLGNTQVRLINHVLFYMDDFLLTGSSKKDLKKAMRMLINYLNEFLLLEVKSKWKISKISDTEPIDMMGFVFRKDRTTIRDKIFLKTRRYFLKAKKKIKKGCMISLSLAYKCVSAYGWYLQTSSWSVRDRIKIDEIMERCKKVISINAKMKERTSNAVIL